MDLIDQLEPQFDRLKTLLARGGREPFLRHPIVPLEPLWFPDRWTPDLESARALAIRLLSYAGLGDLNAEVVAFSHLEHQGFDPINPRLLANVQSDALAVFLGIENGCARFAVEIGQLARPNDLLAVLAREVARAWRRARGIDGEIPIEEELTDLTTVVLGFGILIANTSYRYVEDTVVVDDHYSGSSRRVTGCVDANLLSGMLAVQCLVRGEDSDRVRSYLDTAPLAAFDKVIDECDPDGLRERLELAAEEDSTAPEPTAPPEVVFRPGRAALAVHACSERIVKELGDDGGFVAKPFDTGFLPIEARNAPLVTWGRAATGGGWLRELYLVEDPEWEARLLVLSAFNPGEWHELAVALLSEVVAHDDSDLEDALRPLFEHGDLYLILAGELPAYVMHPERGVLGIDHIEALMSAAVSRLDPAMVLSDAAGLIASAGRAYHRLKPSGDPIEPLELPAQDHEAVISLWWDHASSIEVVSDELQAWGLVRTEGVIASSEETSTKS